MIKNYRKCYQIIFRNLFLQVRVQLHDIKAHPTLTDVSDASTMLGDFRDSMSSSELLNCADAAALLIEDFSSCGIAYLDVTSSCGAISVTKKSCATGYYRLLKTPNNCFFMTFVFSFGHEIGHNFGATHNREQFSSPSGDGYGHLILVGQQLIGPTL